ncbi:heavy metal translocating P-type ATPase [Sporomusa aerivorans]|uniref:heavy metal translocating P-type ATPase n=1 Tax=Sporomusa aerivorans TaxID=204936 RepID=UPI00352A7209
MLDLLAENDYRLLPGRLRITIPGLRKNTRLETQLVRQLGAVAGIRSITANSMTGRALIYFDQAIISFPVLCQEIEKSVEHYAGRQVKPENKEKAVSVPVASQSVSEPGGVKKLYVLATGGVLAGLLAKRLLVGRSPLASSARIFYLAAFTTIIGSYSLLRRGLDTLARKKKINSDLLLFMTTLALLAMRESITGLSVLGLVYLSDLFHYIMQTRSRHAINKMLSDKALIARHLANGELKLVAAEKVNIGDSVIVKAGERVPVDGQITYGEAIVKQSAVNGESELVGVNAGDAIYAGMLIQAGRLTIRATSAGKDTSLARMLQMVEQAAATRGSLQQPGDYYAQKLMPLTMGIAAFILLITRDFYRALTVLLAGCPIAVSIAKNTALGTAVADAARKGIYIKDSQCLELAGQTEVVLWDKTGTLTTGDPTITEVVSLDQKQSDQEVLLMAASAEQNNCHPLARMVVKEAGRKGLTLLPADSEVLVGYGVRASIKQRNIIIGNEALMQNEQIDLKKSKARALRMKHLGNSVVYIAANKKLIGLIGVKEHIRPESRQAVEQLRVVGIPHIGLMTGDSENTGTVVADELGIKRYWSAMKPEDKIQEVTRLRHKGYPVMMVGDGINDSPALAAADIGVTMADDCPELALKAANVAIVGDDPRKVPQMIAIGKRTNKVIRQNLSFAVGINVAGIALAAANIISPLAAALLLNVSTLGVIANSARLLSVRNRASSQQGSFDLQQFAAAGQTAGSIALTPVAAQPAGQSKSPAWYTMPLTNVCDQIEVSPRYGLGGQEVVRRRGKYGLNELAEGKRPSFWELLKKQFEDFMVKVLLGAAGISFFLGKTKDVLLTVAIVVANAVLGVVQERRSERSIAALQRMAAPMTKVIRGGKSSQIKALDLVPGDIIALEAGDRVPADARLLTATNFEVEESSLTGETLPVKKLVDFVGQDELALGDRKNMLFMGTSVTRGKATAVVVATGMQTEMGKIAELINQQGGEVTPLQRRLEELGKYLVYGCLGVSGVVFLIGLLRGERILNMLQTAASLAVAAIPEGLTAIVIIALAMGVQRMSKRNIIIRKLSSIETLGCASVICSDKTGTLTQNQMTVRAIYTADKMWRVSGEGYSPQGQFSYDGAIVNHDANPDLMKTLLAASLCNNAKLISARKPKEKLVNIKARRNEWSVDGDPTEGALLVAAAKAGIQTEALETKFNRVKEIPFESERRMMSVVCQTQDGAAVLYCKGAPDALINVCSHYLSPQGVAVPIDEHIRCELLKKNDELASQALRVLAIAYKHIETAEDYSDEGNLEKNLIFCGLMGMIDPPRPEVPAAIEKCRRAGVKVVMITGDHPNTARAIARELGLMTANDRVVLGQEIDNMSDNELADTAGKVAVYARTSPHHKLRIVKALKAKGYVVAMTGDGVNDAPAVKNADIGIAMGITGTDVTKEAACMTLADDNFATIVRAMEEGRSIYANIRKAIRYLIATNIGEVILMLLAALAGLPLPLIPIQLLWINLVGDGLPAIALVNDPPAKDIMDQPPRSADDSVFSGGLGRKVVTRGIIIGTVSLGLYAWKLFTSGNVIAARTLNLAMLAISQFIHIFDCRLEKEAGKVSLLSNPLLLAAVAISMAMVIGSIHLPSLHSVFGTTALRSSEWLLAFAVAAVTAIIDFGSAPLLAKVIPDRKTPIVPCAPKPMHT